MFEGWLAGVLQEKLGKYLDISRAQLGVGLWSGSIVLNNIELKQLSLPGWPFVLKGGRLRRMEISIPWQALTRKSVVVTVNDLLVVVGARGATTEAERQRERQSVVEEKRQLLTNEEALLGEVAQIDLDGEDGRRRMPESAGSFRERLMASIIANLVVQIHSVRVVYEDDLSEPGTTYSWGLALRSLSLSSCEADGSQSVTREAGNGVAADHAVHKVTFMQGLGIYFNYSLTHTTFETEGPTGLEIHNAAGTGPEAFDSWSECVLNELDGELFLSQQRSRSGRTLYAPRMKLGKVRLRVSTVGARELRRLIGLISDQSHWAEFKQYRPRSRPGSAWGDTNEGISSSTMWWRYAIRGAIQQLRKQHVPLENKHKQRRKAALNAWVEASRLILVRRRYIWLYKRRTTLKGREFAAELAEIRGTASSTELAELQAFEDELAHSYILFFRAIANAELAIEKKQTKSLLKKYKAQKEELLGGRRKRMNLKMTLSEAEYAAAKPIKPTWQTVSKDQRLAVFISLGLACRDDEEMHMKQEMHETPPATAAAAGLANDDATQWRFRVKLTIDELSLNIAAAPEERVGVERKDTAVNCALLRLEILRVRLRRDMYALSHGVDASDYSEQDLRFGSIRMLDESAKRSVVLLQPQVVPSKTANSESTVDMLSMQSVSPTGVGMDGYQSITLQPVAIILAPPAIRLIQIFRFSMVQGTPSPPEPQPTSCNPRTDTVRLDSCCSRSAIRAAMPLVKRTTTMRIVGGSTVWLYSMPEKSASPSLKLRIGQIMCVGAQPPSGVDEITDAADTSEVATTLRHREHRRLDAEGVPPESVGAARDREKGLPLRPCRLQAVVQYYLYKTVDVQISSIDGWLSVAQDPAERIRQGSDADEKMLRCGAITWKIQVLRQPQQCVHGRSILHITPHRKIQMDFPVLSVRLYPAQLRALWHIYLHLGYRFQKIKPGTSWNHPERSSTVGMLTEPWKPWVAERKTGAKSSQQLQDSAGGERWPLKIALNLIIGELQLTMRGYPKVAVQSQPSLLYMSVRQMQIARSTNGIDESRLEHSWQQLHVFLNVEAGDPDSQSEKTHIWRSDFDAAPQAEESGLEWTQGSEHCRHCFLSVWPQQKTTLDRQQTLMGLLHADMTTPAMLITQSKMRRADSNRFDNSQSIKFSPQVEVCVPCTAMLSPMLEALLEAWHAVQFFEDLSTLPHLYEFPSLSTQMICVDRLIITLHLDAPSAEGASIYEAPSRLALNLTHLTYEKQWQFPCAKSIKQFINLEEFGIWDLTRSIKVSPQTGFPEGMCVFLMTKLSLDTTKFVDASAVYSRPFAAAPPYSWARQPLTLSKSQQTSLGGLQIALTHQFVTQLLWYVSRVESLIGPSPILPPAPNNRRVVPTTYAFDVSDSGVRILFFTAPTVSKTALVMDIAKLSIRGELPILEMDICLSGTRLSAADMSFDESDFSSSGFAALRPVSTVAILDPTVDDITLTIGIAADSPARRFLRGSFPILNFTFSPYSTSTLKLVQATLPDLTSRVDPEFVLPSKWDVDISTDAVSLSISTGSEGDSVESTPDLAEYWLEFGLHRVSYARQSRKTKFAVGCIVATSVLCDPVDVLTIGDREDRSVAFRTIVSSGSQPQKEIAADKPAHIYVTAELMSAGLRFYDKFWRHSYTTTRGSVYASYKRLVIAECPRPGLFVSTRVNVVELRLELAEVAQIHVGNITFSKTRPFDSASSSSEVSPATVREELSVDSVHAWSLAGERPRPGSTMKLPCVLALIGDQGERNNHNLSSYFETLGSYRFGHEVHESPTTSSNGSESVPALTLKVDDTKPFWRCPWTAQQTSTWANQGVASAPVPKLNYTLHVMSLFCSLQGEFLQRFVTLVDSVANVFNETLRAHPSQPENQPLHSWVTTPYMCAVKSAGQDRVLQRGSSVLEADVKVELMQLAVPVGQPTPESSVKSSTGQHTQQAEDTTRFEHTRERRALMLSVSFGGKGRARDTWSIDMQIRLMSGTLHALQRTGPYVPHHELTMSSEQPLISEPLSVRATIEHDADSDSQLDYPVDIIEGDESSVSRRTAQGIVDGSAKDGRAKGRTRTLRCDVEKVCITVNEAQYALVLASADQLSALSALERHIYATPADNVMPQVNLDDRSPSIVNPLTSAIRIEGVVFDLTYEQGGKLSSLLSAEASPIFILNREGVELQAMISAVRATTQCSLSLSNLPVSNRHSTLQSSAFPWIQTAPITQAPPRRLQPGDQSIPDPFWIDGRLNKQAFAELWGLNDAGHSCFCKFKLKTKRLTSLGLSAPQRGSGDTHHSVRATQQIRITATSDPDSKIVGTLEVGQVVKVLGLRSVGPRGETLLQTAHGWAPMISSDGVVLLETVQICGPQLDVQLGNADLTVLPELAQATVEFFMRVRRQYSLLIKSKAEIALTLAAAASAPRKSDIVLTEDDVITKDLTLTSHIRLFVKPAGGKKALTLAGNGFSLRFEDDADNDENIEEEKPEQNQGSESLVFVPPGVTLVLVDMVLENFNQRMANLGDNAKISGVVEMANIVDTQIGRSPFRRLRRRSYDSRAERSNSISGSTKSQGRSSDGGSDGGSSDPSKHDGTGAGTINSKEASEVGKLSPGGHQNGVPERGGPQRPDISINLATQNIHVHIMESILIDAESEEQQVRMAPTNLLPVQTVVEPTSLSTPRDMFSYDKTDAIEGGTYPTFELCFQLAFHIVTDDTKTGATATIEGEQIWGAISIDTREVTMSTTTRLNSTGELVAKSDILMPTGASVVITVSEDGSIWDGTSSYIWEVDVKSLTLQVAFSSLQLTLLFSRIYGAALRTDMSPPVLVLEPQGERRAAAKRSVGVHCTMVKLELIDDSQQSWVPLLDFTVSAIEGQTGIHGVGADEEFTESKLAFTVAADSMNNALMEWEPLIEPCPMSMEAVVYTQLLHDTIAVFARDALNVNITRKMLVAMQGAADNWKLVASSPKQLAIANFEKAFELRNDTNDSIVVWLPSTRAQSPSTNRRHRGSPKTTLVEHRLQPGQNVTFNLVTAKRTRKSGKQQHASVRVDVEGYRPVNIEVDRVGVLTYRFDPSHLDTTQQWEPVQMACSVSMSGRSRLASLRAALFLTNETTESFQITTNSDIVERGSNVAMSSGMHQPLQSMDSIAEGSIESDAEAEYSTTMHPGAGISMLAGTRTVWIRPSSQYSWAVVSVPQPVHSKDGGANGTSGGGAGHGQVEAVCHGDNGRDLVCYAVGSTITGDTIKLRVNPTVAIHNRLPYAMKLRVYRYEDPEGLLKPKNLRADHDALVWEGSLDQGACSLQCCASRDDHLLISVAINGFAWSSTAIVSSPLFPVGKHLDLLDATERTLSLGVDVSRSLEEGWHRSISIFCACWIVNLTGLPLQYARAGTSSKAANQPPDGNSSSKPVLISWPKICFKISASQDRGGLDGLIETEDSSEPPRNTVGKPIEFVETEWCKQFSTTAIRTSGMVSLAELGEGSERDRGHGKDKLSAIDHAFKGRVKHRYDVCVTIRLGTGKYRRTKVVRLEPQWMLHNRISVPVVFQQSGTLISPKQLHANASCPIWWTDRSMPTHLRFTLNTATVAATAKAAKDLQRDWSAPVSAAKANNTVIIVGGAITKSAARRTRRCSFAASDLVSTDAEHIAALEGDDGIAAEQLVRVDSQERGTTGAISVVVREYNPATPGYLVENHTAFEVSVTQKGVPNSRRIVLRPHQAKPFVWHLPLEKHHVRLRLSGMNENEKLAMTHQEAAAAATQGLQPGGNLDVEVDFEEFQVGHKKQWGAKAVVVTPEVRPRGPTKVLRVSARPIATKAAEQADKTKVAKTGTVSVKSTTLQRALRRRQVDFLSIAVSAPEVVVALIDYRPSPVEVLCMCMRNLSAEGELEVGQDLRIELALQLLQLDNGNLYSPFPVLLAPTDQESDSPFIQLKMVKSLRDASLNSFPYFSILVQEANVALDDVLVTSVAQFVTGVVDVAETEGYPKTGLVKSSSSVTIASMNHDDTKDFTPCPTTPNRPAHHRRSSSGGSVGSGGRSSVRTSTGSSASKNDFLIGDPDLARMMAGITEFEEAGVLGVDLLENLRPVHCEVLELHPVSVHVTFSMMEAYETGDDSVINDASKAFKAAAGILGVTLANIEQAPIKLNALHMKNVFSTQKQLFTAIAAHYMREAALEVFKIIGTADLLGNPIGLLNNYATGVADFFYEPAHALFHNPLDLGEGVLKGTGSLLKHSVGGSFNTVSKMTGVFGKGVAALSMDDDYLAGRKKSKRRARMQTDHLGHGMIAGVEGLGKGVIGGIAGIVTSPMVEIHRHGVTRGMIAGVAKGIAGTVVKPTVGLLDLAEGVSTGLSNSASVFEVGEALGANSMRQRFRPPRPPHTEGAANNTRRLVPLMLYDRALSYAFALLAKDETYLHHARSVIGVESDTNKLAPDFVRSQTSPTPRNALRNSPGSSSSSGRRSPRAGPGTAGENTTPSNSKGRESFVLITDKRILVFRDVRASDEETAQRFSSTSVTDLKGLTMKHNGLELTLRKQRGDMSPPTNELPDAEPAHALLHNPLDLGEGVFERKRRGSAVGVEDQRGQKGKRGCIDDDKATAESTRTVWLELPPNEVQAAGEQLLLVLAQNH